MTLSDGYDPGDCLFGTKYDDTGYCELYSLKNFTISVSSAVVGRMAAMLFAPGTDVVTEKLQAAAFSASTILQHTASAM